MTEEKTTGSVTEIRVLAQELTERLVGEFAGYVPAGVVIACVTRRTHGMRLSGLEPSRRIALVEAGARADLQARLQVRKHRNLWIQPA